MEYDGEWWRSGVYPFSGFIRPNTIHDFVREFIAIPESREWSSPMVKDWQVFLYTIKYFFYIYKCFVS